MEVRQFIENRWSLCQIIQPHEGNWFRPMNLSFDGREGVARSRKRRVALRSAGALLIAIVSPLSKGATRLVGVRVWPSPDYTRITLESDSRLEVSHFLLEGPRRFVVDIAGLDLSDALKEITTRVRPDDPVLQNVRFGQTVAGGVRIVFDLKKSVTAQVFTLAPVEAYRYRLVCDLYSKSADEGSELRDDEGEGAVKDRTSAISSPVGGGEKKGRVASAPDRLRGAGLVVALDPGHGGEDPGAVGLRGTKEKDVVLALARQLRKRLEADHGMRVLLTRDGDFFVPLHERVRKARAARADLFISLHADAWVDRRANGTSVFALSEKGATSTSAKWLASNQNSADLVGGLNLKTKERVLAGVLLDLSTTAQIRDSLDLGGAVLQELSGVNRLHRGIVEQAGFAVLKAPDIPSILVETAFISNPDEELKLLDEGYRDKVTKAIAEGILKYVGPRSVRSSGRAEQQLSDVRRRATDAEVK